MDRNEQIALLQTQFEDEGREILRRAGVPSWARALAELEVDGVGSAAALLAALRDHWEQPAPEAALMAGGLVVGLLREELGDDAAATLAAVARLGQLLLIDDFDQGQALIERAWEGATDVAAGDPDRARVAAALGGLRMLQDRPSEAIFPLREALRVLGEREPALVAQASFELGRAMVEFGSVEEGLRLVEASVRHARQHGAPELAERLSVYASLIAERYTPKDAEGVHREAVEAAIRVYGARSPEAGLAQAALATLLFRFAGRADEGLGILDVAMSLLMGSAGPSDPRTRNVAAQLVERLIEVGRRALERKDRTLARESFSRAEGVSLDVFGPGDGRLVRVRDLASRL